LKNVGSCTVSWVRDGGPVPSVSTRFAEAMAYEGALPMADGSSDRKCFINAGQIYYGDVITGTSGECVRHGQGRQINLGVTLAGEKVILGSYEGAWKSGRMTGTGTYRWSDGSEYEGAFLDGRLHGYGQFHWPEGSVYDGMWEVGEMTGQGRFDNAFDGISTQGVFFRNNIQQYDGSWVDLHRFRLHLRTAWLKIGALGPGVESNMPVHRCTPAGLLEQVAAALRTNLIPLILADTTVGPDPTEKSRSAAPLWCLEQGDRGCTPDSAVYISFAAAEKRRKRNYQQVFRNAIQKALVEYRPFALVFGASSTGNPQDGGPLPDAWKLTEFFDRFCLPPDLFDLQHFHGSGDVDFFLPDEAKAKTDASMASPASNPEVLSAPAPGSEAAPEDAEESAPPEVPALPPPMVRLLRFVMVSLGRVEAGLNADAIRAHVGRLFAAHVPLHRVSTIVVSTDA